MSVNISRISRYILVRAQAQAPSRVDIIWADDQGGTTRHGLVTLLEVHICMETRWLNEDYAFAWHVQKKDVKWWLTDYVYGNVVVLCTSHPNQGKTETVLHLNEIKKRKNEFSNTRIPMQKSNKLVSRSYASYCRIWKFFLAIYCSIDICLCLCPYHGWFNSNKNRLWVRV